MTDNEYDKKFEEVTEINKKIRQLDKEKSNLILEIQAENKKRVLAMYPDVKVGDKVKVVYEDYFYYKEKNTQNELIGYFGGAELSSWDKNTTNLDSLYITIFKIKKDGTTSLKKDSIHPNQIISITKID